jgi:hypothetical protein
MVLNDRSNAIIIMYLPSEDCLRAQGRIPSRYSKELSSVSQLVYTVINLS